MSDDVKEKLDPPISAAAVGEFIHRAIGEMVPFGVWTADAGGDVDYISQAFLDLVGLSLKQIRGGELANCMAVEDRAELLKAWDETIAHDRQWNYEFRVNAADGRKRYILSQGTSIRDVTGKIIRWAGINLDITARREAEDELRRHTEQLDEMVRLRTAEIERKTHRLSRYVRYRKTAHAALRQSEEMFRALAENAQVVIGMVRERRFIYVNPYLEKLSGYSRKELLSVDIGQLVHPSHRQMIIERAAKRQRGEPVPGHYEFMMVAKDGREVWLDFSPAVFMYKDKPAIIGAAYDVTERKKAEAELEAIRENLERTVADRTAVAERRAAQLRTMTLELIVAESRERRRLSKVLHDDLQQLLVGAKLRVGMARTKFPQIQECNVMKDVEGLLLEALELSRSLSHEMSPPILHETSLVKIIEWLAQWIHEKHGLEVKVEACEVPVEVPEHLRELVFECTKEVLFNVVKHSQMHKATVRIWPVGTDGVQVDVLDEGVGFDPAGISKKGETFGLFSIRQRLEGAGGCLDIESAPGKGTHLTMFVPIAPQPPAAQKAAG